jgi:hypothetical protein
MLPNASTKNSLNNRDLYRKHASLKPPMHLNIGETATMLQQPPQLTPTASCTGITQNLSGYVLSVHHESVRLPAAYFGNTLFTTNIDIISLCVVIFSTNKPLLKAVL